MTVHTHGTEGSTHPAEVAQQETSRVTQEATAQAKDLAGQVRSQVQDQAEAQRTRAAQQLRSLGDGLHKMAQSGDAPGPAQDLVTEVANRTRSLAEFVESRDAGQLLDEARSLARRKPMVFLAGMAVAGAVVGRLSRGAISAATGGDSNDNQRQSFAQTSGEDYIDLSAPATGTTQVTPGYGGPDYAGAGLVGGTVAEPAIGTTTEVYSHGTDTGATAGRTSTSITGDDLAADDLPDESTLGPLGTSTTTTGEQPPRASGTEGSFHV